jgi:hypothetical protein
MPCMLGALSPDSCLRFIGSLEFIAVNKMENLRGVDCDEASQWKRGIMKVYRAARATFEEFVTWPELG